MAILIKFLAVTTVEPKWQTLTFGGDYGGFGLAILSLGGDYAGPEVAILTLAVTTAGLR